MQCLFTVLQSGLKFFLATSNKWTRVQPHGYSAVECIGRSRQFLCRNCWKSDQRWLTLNFSLLKCWQIIKMYFAVRIAVCYNDPDPLILDLHKIETWIDYMDTSLEFSGTENTLGCSTGKWGNMRRWSEIHGVSEMNKVNNW